MAVDIYTIVTSTTALEGSTLSDSENRLLLEKGISSYGKSIHEQMLNLNVKKAYEAAYKMAQGHEFWSVYRLRQLGEIAFNFNPSVKMEADSELERFCDKANEFRRHIPGMSEDQLYEASFQIHFGLSRLKVWSSCNDLMARLLMNQFQHEAKIDPIVIGAKRAEEYKKILAIAIEEDIADIFTNYMMAHIGDRVDLYKSAGPIIVQPGQLSQEPAYRPRVRGATRDGILKLLRKHPFMSAADLAAELGISDKAVEKQISILKKTDSLRRVGPDKGGRWVVTDKAIA